MPILNKIRRALGEARADKKKTATFHSMILIHAAELDGMGSEECCRQLGLQKSYKTEFGKMISASRRLAELGYSVKKNEGA